MLAVLIAFPVSAAGQSGPSSDIIFVRSCLRYGHCPTAERGLDRRVLFTVRSWDARSARVFFGAADASAYPVFAAGPLLLWGGALADRLPQEDAVAGTIALATGFATAIAMKRIVGRTRPYAAIPGFQPRSGYTGAIGLSDTSSFPSGHATLAGIVATGAALLIRHPAATAGAAVWAGAVSASRVWLGVHYPTDVAAGITLGTGTTLVIMSVMR